MPTGGEPVAMLTSNHSPAEPPTAVRRSSGRSHFHMQDRIACELAYCDAAQLQEGLRELSTALKCRCPRVILSHKAVWHTPDIDCGAKQDRVLEHSTHDVHTTSA